MKENKLIKKYHQELAITVYQFLMIETTLWITKTHFKIADMPVRKNGFQAFPKPMKKFKLCRAI